MSNLTTLPMSPTTLFSSLLFLILLSSSITPSFSSPSNLSHPTILNQTVYDTSRSLCWNCLSESIEFLYGHNMVRAAHLELPLAWDQGLESYARWWANLRKKDCEVEHSFPEDGFVLGENLFSGSGSNWTPSDAVRSWAAEETYYSYAANACTPGHACGHYTQIVWRRTLRVGCARVICDDGDVFISCNYYPPGNYVGERPY